MVLRPAQHIRHAGQHDACLLLARDVFNPTTLVTVVRAVVVDEGRRGGRFTGFGHGVPSFRLDEVNVNACNLDAHSDR